MAIASAAATKKWAREYETIYILKSNIDPDEAAKIANRIPEVVDRLGGKVTKVDNWGKRKLAYPIQKNTRGIFVFVKYVGFNDLVAEIERNLRLFDSVIRYQTVVHEGRIDPANVVVDPEEVKFVAIEQTEDEPELDAAQRLGLVPSEHEERRRGPAMEGDELDEMDADDIEPGAAPSDSNDE